MAGVLEAGMASLCLGSASTSPPMAWLTMATWNERRCARCASWAYKRL